MSGNQVILNFEGLIDFQTSEVLLQQVKNDLDSHPISKTLKKRIYSVMVECIENVMRHSDSKMVKGYQPSIRLEKTHELYEIVAGNIISNLKVGLLEEKLEKIVHSNEEQLHEMYEKQIDRDAILVTDGAGLGFLTMALKSGRPIEYKITEVNDEFSVFELCVSIPVDTK